MSDWYEPREYEKKHPDEWNETDYAQFEEDERRSHDSIPARLERIEETVKTILSKLEKIEKKSESIED